MQDIQSPSLTDEDLACLERDTFKFAVERKSMTRAEAAKRTLTTIRFI